MSVQANTVQWWTFTEEWTGVNHVWFDKTTYQGQFTQAVLKIQNGQEVTRLGDVEQV